MIFICMFDPFGRERYCYTYRETCAEDGELLGDGTCKIFLNVKGKNSEEVSRELVDFLHYVEKAELPEDPDDDFLRHLHETISQIKHDRRMEGRYMTFGELLDDERREGHAEGLAEGHAEGLAEGHAEGLAEGHAEGLAEGHAEGLAEGQSMFMRLIDAMNEDGRTSEIPRLTKNQAFREAMFAQYHIMADIGAIQKD